jgi:integration host factor subunit alpha
MNKGALIMTLTKADIVEAVAKQNGYTNKRSFEVIETLLEIIKSSLESGQDVLISGFGKFCVNEKKERLGRNPATGEAMMLAPRKVVTFKCSRQLRDKING